MFFLQEMRTRVSGDLHPPFVRPRNSAMLIKAFLSYGKRGAKKQSAVLKARRGWTGAVREDGSNDATGCPFPAERTRYRSDAPAAVAYQL